MNLDGILSTFSPEVRESPSMKGLVILIQTLLEQLQATQEQLTKAQEKIKTLEDELAKLRKTPKRPEFRPNGMQPRSRGYNLTRCASFHDSKLTWNLENSTQTPMNSVHNDR